MTKNQRSIHSGTRRIFAFFGRKRTPNVPQNASGQMRRQVLYPIRTMHMIKSGKAIVQKIRGPTLVVKHSTMIAM
jgi:hypothetical protein